MADQTLERLQGRYLARNRTSEEDLDPGALREAKRQAGQFRDRLVVNYSPLVKYVASRVGARLATGAVEQEDMISWGVLGLLEAIERYDPNSPGEGPSSSPTPSPRSGGPSWTRSAARIGYPAATGSGRRR